MNNASNPVPVPESDGTAHPLVGAEPRDFGGQATVGNDTGLVMPALGIGTYELVDATAFDMVSEALRLGIRHIDTAQMYGNEAAIGRAIAGAEVSRDEVFITTKVANDCHRPDDLVRSVHGSLERLGTDHVDLLLLHWPTAWDLVAATLATLANVQAAGYAHHIGVSNFTREQLEIASSHAPLEVLQVECHPYLQQRELRAWCAEHGWLFTAYSPLAQGTVLDDDVLTEIAAEHGTDTTSSQVALAWLSYQPGVSAIPRTSDVEHLESNWAARHLRLTSEQQQRIADLDRNERVVPLMD